MFTSTRPSVEGVMLMLIPKYSHNRSRADLLQFQGDLVIMLRILVYVTPAISAISESGIPYTRCRSRIAAHNQSIGGACAVWYFLTYLGNSFLPF